MLFELFDASLCLAGIIIKLAESSQDYQVYREKIEITRNVNKSL